MALKPRPSLVENFIGRDDILDSMQRTHFFSRSSQSQTPAITVLYGLGGSGKTQTVLKFALVFEEM
jgi:Cdc6-like AAA superfamily ATPase